jgi:hypothetical protein
MSLTLLRFRGTPDPLAPAQVAIGPVPWSVAIAEIQCSSGFQRDLAAATAGDPALVWCIGGAECIPTEKKDAPELPLSRGTPRR